MIITVDGASGTGKTSISRRLARSLKFAFLDSGALYRTIAFGACLAGIEEKQEIEIANWLTKLDLKIKLINGHFITFLNGDNVEIYIRNEIIANIASRLSTLQVVRTYLLTLQQEISEKNNLVAEGRDMGTIVFPKAEIKFFLTAKNTERARRRWLQLKLVQPKITLTEVTNDIFIRDKRDTYRILSPLKPAQNALIINTSKLTKQNVLKNLLFHIQQYLAKI